MYLHEDVIFLKYTYVQRVMFKCPYVHILGMTHIQMVFDDDGDDNDDDDADDDDQKGNEETC